MKNSKLLESSREDLVRVINSEKFQLNVLSRKIAEELMEACLRHGLENEIKILERVRGNSEFWNEESLKFAREILGNSRGKGSEH